MDKSPDAFRTISEVAELLETPAHVLRFWESRFPQIKPVKRAGGRRYYRPADLALLTGIRRLLHDEGLTIRGVQKILREQGVRHVSGLVDDDEGEAGFTSDETVQQPIADVVVSSDPIPLFPNLASPPPLDVTAHDIAETAGAADSTAEGDTLLPDGSEGGDDPAPDDVVAAEDQSTAPEGPFAQIDIADDTVALPESLPPEAVDAAEEDGSAPEFPFDGPFDAGADTVSESGVAVSDLPEVADDPTIAATPQPDPFESPTVAVTQEDPPTLGAEADVEPVPNTLPKRETGAVAANDPANDTAQVTEDATPIPPAPTAPALPPELEITGHWLPADLRALRKGALAGKTDQAAALFNRLEALRNRVGDRGRVPRR